MRGIVKLLDKNLKYIKHEIKGDTIYIHVKSRRKKVECPTCGVKTDKVHSRYTRSFQDLPVGGKKVVIVLERRIFVCKNKECGKKRFAEPFEFLSEKAKMTKRLEEEIANIAQKMSLIETSKYLRKNVANVGKSTVNNILKKKKVKKYRGLTKKK